MNLKFLEKTNLKVLELFLSSPSLEISRGEAAKKLKISKATAVKRFDSLVEAKFLLEHEIGRNKLLRLNNDSVVVRELKKIFILSYLHPLDIKDAEVYLFGSAARGDYVELSDIDILMLGKVHRNVVVEKMEKLEKKTKRKINFQIFTPQEWSMMAKKDPAFYERVEKDKIQLN